MAAATETLKLLVNPYIGIAKVSSAKSKISLETPSFSVPKTKAIGSDILKSESCLALFSGETATIL